jgi:hypothetical protein
MGSEMTRLPPTPSTIKKLFAYTGNQCAMPNCKELIVDPSGTMLGKIAHICSAEPGGARYDTTMSDEERRDEKNLFIVCGKHHDIIDDKNNEAKWPVDLLRSYKRDHENRFKKAERQLIAQFVDSTQVAQPTYPKHLKALAKVSNWESMFNDPDQILGISMFIDKLKEVPLSEREFALKIAERMKRRGLDALPTDDVEGAFNISSEELKRRMDILKHHVLGDIDEAMEYRKWDVSLYRRKHGENPWIEILEFCEATKADPREFIHDLNFGLYDG